MEGIWKAERKEKALKKLVPSIEVKLFLSV
jgi:hypothetical protein